MIRKKLHSCRGETLVETLCAILVITFSALVLMNFTLSAARVNQAVREEEENFRQELDAAERFGASGALTWDAALTITDGVSGHYTYQIEATGGTDKLTSYRMKGGG